MAQETKTSDVTVLSPMEEAMYGGVTVDESGGESRRTEGNMRTEGRMNFRHIELGHSSNKWLTRLIGGAIALAVGAFVIFVALPALLVLLAVALVAWLVFSYMQR